MKPSKDSLCAKAVVHEAIRTLKLGNFISQESTLRRAKGVPHRIEMLVMTDHGTTIAAEVTLNFTQKQGLGLSSGVARLWRSRRQDAGRNPGKDYVFDFTYTTEHGIVLSAAKN